MEKVVIIDLAVKKHKSEDYEAMRNREKLQEELNSQEINPFSFESYMLTENDVKDIKLAKKVWKINMKKDDPNFKAKKHKWTHTLQFETFKELLSKAV